MDLEEFCVRFVKIMSQGGLKAKQTFKPKSFKGLAAIEILFTANEGKNEFTSYRIKRVDKLLKGFFINWFGKISFQITNTITNLIINNCKLH